MLIKKLQYFIEVTCTTVETSAGVLSFILFVIANSTNKENSLQDIKEL